MTREERNRKISELRGNWAGTVLGAQPVDWHSDCLWPTLLREMPPRTELTRQLISGWQLWFPLEHSGHVERFTELADVVCEAWLKWRKSNEQR